MRKVLIAIALAGALTACGIVDNPQSSAGDPNIPPSTDTGIVVTLKDFTPYAGKQVDMRLVGGDGTVLGVYRTEHLTLDSFNDYRLEILSVPKKPDSYVDILVDQDGDGSVDPASEPAWTKPLTNNAVTFSGADEPSGAPEPEQPGGDLTMSFTGFGALDGKLLRLAMINPAGQITGLYTGTVRDDNFDVVLPQIVVNTEPYTFAIFADTNGNGHYDTPPTDAAWYAYATGDVSGITYVFAYNENFEDVDFER